MVVSIFKKFQGEEIYLAKILVEFFVGRYADD